MITCQCGCKFQNSRGDSFVTCPQCHRVYANKIPDFYHPLSEEARRWTCDFCGFFNEDSEGIFLLAICAKCGQPRYPVLVDELTEDIQLFSERISLRNGHAGSRTVYRAATRTVEYSAFVIRGRIFPRTQENEGTLKIPGEIKTKEQLRQYVQSHRSTWIPK